MAKTILFVKSASTPSASETFWMGKLTALGYSLIETHVSIMTQAIIDNSDGAFVSRGASASGMLSGVPYIYSAACAVPVFYMNRGAAVNARIISGSTARSDSTYVVRAVGDDAVTYAGGLTGNLTLFRDPTTLAPLATSAQTGNSLPAEAKRILSQLNQTATTTHSFSQGGTETLEPNTTLRHKTWAGYNELEADYVNIAPDGITVFNAMAVATFGEAQASPIIDADQVSLSMLDLSASTNVTDITLAQVSGPQITFTETAPNSFIWTWRNPTGSTDVVVRATATGSAGSPVVQDFTFSPASLGYRVRARSANGLSWI